MSSIFVICLLAGGVGSVLQGMLGIGTGVVIVPILSYLLHDQGFSYTDAMRAALATSMAAIAVNSMSALRSHYQNKNIKWIVFRKSIGFSISGAFLGARIASYSSGRILQCLFGMFLLGIAIYLLVRRSPPFEVIEQDSKLNSIGSTRIRMGSFCIGFIASLVGSGGGVLMVPFLHGLGSKMRHAVGTSTLIGFPVAISGALSYAIANESMSIIYWPALAAISVAGMLGAPLGVKLATLLNTRVLLRCFSMIMMAVGARMIMG